MNGRQLEIRFGEIEALEAEITAHQDAYQAGKPSECPQIASESILSNQTCKYMAGNENARTAQNKANSGHLSKETEMTVLRFDDVSRHLDVADTREQDDGVTWTLTNGGKIRLTWGYAVGNQLGCHNHHNAFAMWEWENEDGELIESVGMDVDDADAPITAAMWVVFEVRACRMLADLGWLSDAGWRLDEMED